MRFAAYPVLLLMLIVFSSPALAASDRIVAVVNGEVITLKQLDNRVEVMMKNRQAAAMGKEAMRKRVLDALVEQELINQAAKAKGVFVTESDVSQALESIKKENKLSDAQFKASLAQGGTTVEAFREDLRIEILRNRVLGSQVMSKIVVTDSEVTAFLRGEGPDLEAMGGGTGDTRPLRMIIIPKAQGRSEALRIINEIKSGKLSFSAAAKKYSKGPGRDKGGDPGDGGTVGSLPPEMQQAFRDKKSEEPIDQPADAGNALVILAAYGDPPPKKEPVKPSKDKKGKVKADPNEFTAEARESARRQLERYKMQQRYTKWVEDLKKNAIIRVNL